MNRTAARAGTTLVVGLFVVACGDPLTEDGAERDESGEVVEEGDVGALALQVGDCIDSSETGEVDAVPVVPCTQPHEGEVFALFDLLPGDFPGDSEVTDLAAAGCTGERFSDYVGTDYEVSRFEVSFLQPTEQTWDAVDDREIVCLAVSATGDPLLGSVEGRAA